MKNIFAVFYDSGKSYCELMHGLGFNLAKVVTEQRNSVLFCVDSKTHDQIMKLLGVKSKDTKRLIRCYRVKVVR